MFNPKKVLECWELELSNSIYVNTVDASHKISMHSIPKWTSNVDNVTHWFSAFQNFFQIENSLEIKEVMRQNVDTVNTVEKHWFWAFQNFFQIENPLNIKEVMSDNVDIVNTKDQKV